MEEINNSIEVAMETPNIDMASPDANMDVPETTEPTSSGDGVEALATVVVTSAISSTAAYKIAYANAIKDMAKMQDKDAKKLKEELDNFKGEKKKEHWWNRIHIQAPITFDKKKDKAKAEDEAKTESQSTTKTEEGKDKPKE